MNIPTTAAAIAWRMGYADGRAERRNETLYARDDEEARCYRDGHRMGRRELQDGTPESPIRMEMETIIEPGGTAKTMYIAPQDERAAAVAPPVPGERLPTADDAGAFNDPVPGKRKTKQPKPADPDQASLF